MAYHQPMLAGRPMRMKGKSVEFPIITLVNARKREYGKSIGSENLSTCKFQHSLANQYISGKIYNTISYTQSVIQKVGKLQNQLLINK